MIKGKKTLARLLILGMCWTVIYALGFIQYLLYDPFRESLGCTNAELGFLMTIFGLGNIFGAPIGGWIADRFDFKKVFCFSLVGNGILAAIFAMNMNYQFAIFIWIGLAVTTLVMNYPSHIKIIRMMADEKNQGKIFGLNESFVGVGSIVFNAILLFVFAKFVDVVGGIRAVIWVIAVVSILCAIGAWLLIRDLEDADAATAKAAETEEKISGKDFLIVLRSPATWILGMGIFCVYSCAVTMSYFTPYLTAVMGGTVAVSGVLAIIRTYGLRLVGAPLGGWLADKINSVLKVLIVVYILGIIVLALFIKLPSSTPASFFIFLTLLVGCLVYMGKGCYYAVASELYIPRKYAATTVGIAAALGFSPDVFLFALTGHWLDTYGNAGYQYLFIYQGVVFAVGIVGTMLALVYKKKHHPAEASGEIPVEA